MFVLKPVEISIRSSTLSSRNLVCFNFYVTSTRYNFLKAPNSPFPRFVNKQIFNTSAEHMETVTPETIEADEIALSLQMALLPLNFRNDVRENLVQYAVNEYHRALETKVEYTVGRRYKIILEFKIEWTCYHVHDSLHEITPAFVPPASNKYDTQSCCICFEEFGGDEDDEEDEELMEMPCEHMFHCACIEKWLRTRHYCPLCRFPMPDFLYQPST